MTKELNLALEQTGLTLTAIPFLSGVAKTPIVMVEIGATGIYQGDMAGVAGNYEILFSSGGTYDGWGQIAWDGSKEITIAETVWDENLTAALHNDPTSAGRRVRTISSSVVLNGNAQSSTSNTITFNGDASSVNGAYDPSAISIISGTGAGQSRLIIEYNGATKTAVVDRDWKINPGPTSEYVISAHPGREHVNEGLAGGGSINTITLNSAASSINETYTGQNVFIRSGAGQDQVARVTSYDGATRTATICKNWHTVPGPTSGYVMLPTGYLDGTILGNKITGILMAYAVETGFSFQEILKLMVSALAGILSGAEGNTITIRDINDTVDRITATVDPVGNRTAVIKNVS